MKSKSEDMMMKEPPAVGMLLQSGPPPHFLFRFIERNVVKQLRFDLTTEQCAQLGTKLIWLAGVTEARAGEAGVPAAPRSTAPLPPAPRLGAPEFN